MELNKPTSSGLAVRTRPSPLMAEDDFQKIAGSRIPTMPSGRPIPASLLTFPGHPSQVTLSDEGLVRELLRIMGDNPDREGLKETPRRFLKAMREYTLGYSQDPKDVMKSFEDGAELCGDELVIVRDVSFTSLCEHHIAPFWGHVHIGYIPNGKVLGLSKFIRLTDIFARRFQVQERLTNQIANAIQEHLNPIGVGVVIEATHSCICFRGVKREGSTTVTSALRGALKEKPEARAEFMTLIWGSKQR